jgi:hypothetical protein
MGEQEPMMDGPMRVVVVVEGRGGERKGRVAETGREVVEGEDEGERESEAGNGRQARSEARCRGGP